MMSSEKVERPAVDFFRLTSTAVPESIARIIAHNAQSFASDIAIVGPSIGTISFDELLHYIDALRVVFKRCGITSESRIGVAIPAGPEAAVTTIAISCHATCVPLNPTLPKDAFLREFSSLSLDALVVADWILCPASDAAEDFPGTLFHVSKAGAAFAGFDIRCVRQGLPSSRSLSTNEHRAIVLRTSATTGPGKLVPVTDGNIIEMAIKMQKWFGLTRNDRAACTLPMYYAQGCKTTLLVPLLLGGSVAIPESGRLESVIDCITTLAPTWLSAGPTFLQGLLDALGPLSNGRLPHSLRFILSSSAPLNAQTRERVENAFGVPVLEFYGLSEAGIMAANPPPPELRKPGTAGRVSVGEMEIRDENGKRAAAGEIGQIYITGPSVMPGYIPDNSNREELQDGWLATGDLGSIDGDGFLTLTGRLKEIINRGGEKVAPLDVESAVLLHPEVREAAAFGVPHPRLGENVAMAVVLKRGAPVTASDLRVFLAALLPSYKVPQRIDLVEALPKGSTGKVLRNALRELTVRNEPLYAPPEDPLESDIKELWQRLLKSDQIGIRDDFFEAGGDSLLAIQMLAELELLTGRTISDSILLDAPTIAQLAEVLSDGDYQRQKTLFRLNPKGSRPPLFYFHVDFIQVGYSARMLARFLGSDQPILVIDPHGMGNSPIPKSIEAMAAERLPLILNAESEGPYRLCGYCFGGLVAFEVARMLIADGKKVELVAMLDPPTGNASRQVQLLLSTLKRVRPIVGPAAEQTMVWMWHRYRELQKFRNFSWSKRWALITAKIRALAESIGEAVQPQPIVEEKESVTERRRRYGEAILANYFPKPLAVRVVYFSVDYGAGAWRQIVSELEVIKSPGDHHHLDFNHIAEHLRARL